MGRFFKTAVLLQVIVMSCVHVTPSWPSADDNFAVSSPQKIIEQKCNEYNKHSSCVQPRIIGGAPARENQFPFMVLITLDGKPACGGTLISEKFVLTTARCIYSSDSRTHVTAFMGVLNITERDRGLACRVVRIIYPGGYQPGPFNLSQAQKIDDPKNIALLELEKPVVFNQNIYPACVFSGDSSQLETAVVAGWGRTNCNGENTWPDVLQWVELSIHPFCPVPGLLCAGTPIVNGICEGDFGGPLVTFDGCSTYLVGIAAYYFGKSWCGGLSMFTNVSLYSRWISHHVWKSLLLPVIESKEERYSF